MVAITTYQIEVQGPVDEDALNASSPQKAKVMGSGIERTILAVQCDQAGLVGMIRYLHQQRFVILAMRRDSLSNWNRIS